MNYRRSVSVGAGCCLVAVLYQYGWLGTILNIALNITVIIVAAYLGVTWTIVRGKQYKPSSQAKDPSVMTLFIKKMMDKLNDPKREPKKVIISRNMDSSVQEVIDLAVRDFVLSWYQTLGKNEEKLLPLIQSDVWHFVGELTERLSQVDLVKMITQDIVDKLHDHFKNIRYASRKSQFIGHDTSANKGIRSARCLKLNALSRYLVRLTSPTFFPRHVVEITMGNKDSVPVSKFLLHSWLEGEETEVDFLRKLSDALLLILMPKHYDKCDSLRHLLREIVTLSVLKPTIDMICDPDYINQKLIGYIEYREKLSEDTRKTYTYAATYEDFVKMIDDCSDIEHLKQIRYNIITEIMQATTINNLKKAQGINSDKETSPKSMTKGDLLKSRNLKRYINQLTVAKARCEKRMHLLGGQDYKSYLEWDEETALLPGQMVLSFSVIMDSLAAREQFMKYLKRDDNDSLLGFWVAIETLKNADKKHKHQIGSEIYHRYISSSTSAVRLDKVTIKGMEAFMMGNTGPDAFMDAQRKVYLSLEEQHYPSFIVSDIYHKYIASCEDEKAEMGALGFKEEFFLDSADAFIDVDDPDKSAALASQSYYAQLKLEQLDDKVMNKAQALQAMKASPKADAKIKKLEEDLEKELEQLKLEKRLLQAHIERTEYWCENHGKWRATVYNAEIVQEDDKMRAYFVIVVHMFGSGMTIPPGQNGTQGWVISRTIDEFQSLHEKLVQIGPWLRKKELPSVGKSWFKSIDSAFLEKAKKSLEEYLVAILKDERMTQSEALYGFLTPTPEYLKQRIPEKRSKFFLANIFKSFPSIGQADGDIDDELLFAGDESSKDDRSKDSIAEPLYKLISEVFELRGMFKWLRKSFILFVEISFGRSINRQLRETIDWIFSEPMVIYYIRLCQDSIWPDGKLAESAASRTDEQKLRTRIEAKEKFLENMPDAVKTLVGEENGRRGAIKMFEVLQDSRLNKQLFYVLLELLLFDICPEIRPPSAAEGTNEVVTNNA